MSWKTICWEAILLGFLFSCPGSDKDPMDRKYQIDYDYLKSNFQQPDRTYGVNCWWWRLNGNVTKEAITKDLEAMRQSGIGGATILQVNSGFQFGNYTEGVSYYNEKWWSFVEFAVAEAKRLGLELGIHNCPGYSASGAHGSQWINQCRN